MSLICKTFNIGTNPESVKKGDIVLFITGENKSHQRPPCFLRVGEVVQGYNDGVLYENGKGYTVKELVTGKIWHPYTQDTVLIDGTNIIMGVSAEIIFKNSIL